MVVHHDTAIRCRSLGSSGQIARRTQLEPLPSRRCPLLWAGLNRCVPQGGHGLDVDVPERLTDRVRVLASDATAGSAAEGLVEAGPLTGPLRLASKSLDLKLPAAPRPDQRSLLAQRDPRVPRSEARFNGLTRCVLDGLVMSILS
jgi:hypothetical protein